MKARLDKLRQVLKKENLDAAVFAILDKDDSGEGPGPRWLTGYSGSTASVFVNHKNINLPSYDVGGAAELEISNFTCMHGGEHRILPVVT